MPMGKMMMSEIFASSRMRLKENLLAVSSVGQKDDRLAPLDGAQLAERGVERVVQRRAAESVRADDGLAQQVLVVREVLQEIDLLVEVDDERLVLAPERVDEPARGVVHLV